MFSSSDHKRRIAVIAVHGVADQQPHQTAYQAAGLLIGEQLLTHYSAFSEKEIHIGLEKAKVNRSIKTRVDSIWHFPPVQSSTVSQNVYRNEPITYSDGSSRDPENLSAEEIEHDSMREQLQGYQTNAADSTHRTIVLTSTRSADDLRSEEPIVDIYESYWADLSRLKKGFFSLFFEFYLLLFFFSRIGGITVERAVAHFPNKKIWRHLQRFHWISEMTLVLGVPLTHLSLLTLSASGAPYLIEWLPLAPPIEIVFVLLAILSTIIIGMLIGYLTGRNIHARWWHWLFPLIALSTLAVNYYASLISNHNMALVLLVWFLLSVGMLCLAKLYDSRRPGAFLIAVISQTITAIVFITCLLNAVSGSKSHLFEAGVNATALVASLNVLMWVTYIFSSLVASIIGLIAVYRTPKKQRTIANRTAWTQALTMTISGVIIMLATFSLWQVLLVFAENVMGGIAARPLASLIADQVFPHLSIGLGIAAVAALFALWLILPAPLSEFVCKRKSDRNSIWVGDTLSSAFNKMRGVGEVFRLLVLVAIPVEWFFLMSAPAISSVIEFQQRIILYCGLLMVTVLFASKGPLSFLALGFRAGLDIALDVTNWLRMQPQQTNARGAICRRYTSLLRHISLWRDPITNRGYDGVVIVAHSQGTVITADLLRYFKQEYDLSSLQESDPAIARYFDKDDPLSISLMTFGSPLRQLYNRRFPVQYHWAGEHDANENSLQRNIGPDPAQLGLTQWSNLYCSGDYIGRHLWYEDGDPQCWLPIWSNQGERKLCYPNTREICLGAGGHTQYWKGGLTEVANELDRIICKASNSKSS